MHQYTAGVKKDANKLLFMWIVGHYSDRVVAAFTATVRLFWALTKLWPAADLCFTDLHRLFCQCQTLHSAKT